MAVSRCAAKCQGCHTVSRRQFVATASASLLSASLLGNRWSSAATELTEKIKPKGPASQFTANVKACFVRRKGEYGMRWPGQIYDGVAAKEKYTKQLQEAANKLKVDLDLRPAPIHSIEEAETWLAEAKAAQPDGLLMVLLDRQEHSWPSAVKAVDTGIPTVVFSPIGSSFTTNTVELAHRQGCFICSTDDFRQVEYGLKMLHAGAKTRATRCLVLRGRQTADGELPHLGTKLRYVPAQTFLDLYEQTPANDDVLAMAKRILGGARHVVGATEQDVINGVRSYLVAGKLLEQHESDAITMDCLGALGRSKVSLPCIAWSQMNDDMIPAACEADLGAVATHIVVQYLFDRPGFQQDPVAETAREAIIGAHCSCPTRLEGFDGPEETYDVVHHHGVRDATRRPLWKLGQRVTCADVLLGGQDSPTKMIISAGEVVDNISVPPAGGCVVSVMAKFDNVSDVLAYPGFHQLFFYGDYKRELAQFCRLFHIEPVVV